MPEEMTVRHLYNPSDDRVRVKLIKNTKGYGWEVSVGGKDQDEALALLQDVEKKVREEFGGTEG